MRRHHGVGRSLHAGDELSLLRRSARLLSCERRAADLRVIGGGLRCEQYVQGGRRERRAATERLRLLEVAVRSARAPALRARRARRSSGCGTSTCTVRARRTRARWRASPSTCTSQVAATGEARSVRRQRRVCRRRAAPRLRIRGRRGRREPVVLRAAPRCPAVFNVGTGASATFNDVANAIIAWHGKGAIRYIPFPAELQSRYQSFTEADIGALRAAGYTAPFRDVRAGVKAYLDAIRPADVTAPDKVLVVGPSWVGDMVMAQALYRLLKQRSAAAEIHVVAPPWSLPVLERMPEVARGIELAVDHGELGLGRRRALGRDLRGERYCARHRAAAFREGRARAVVCARAAAHRISRRMALRASERHACAGGVARSNSQALRRARARAMTSPSSRCPRSCTRVCASARRTRSGCVSKHGLDAREPLIALMPGAEYGPAKRWPATRFGELARWLAGAGTNVIVLGSAKEQVARAMRSWPRPGDRACAIFAVARRWPTSSISPPRPMRPSATIPGCCTSRLRAARRSLRSTARRRPQFTPPLTDVRGRRVPRHRMQPVLSSASAR